MSQPDKMSRLMITTFRKIIKMGSKVDRSLALRARVACAPQYVYDHRRMEWEPLDAAKISDWPQSREFVDAVIRKLNAGRQFFLPMPPASTASPSPFPEKLSPAPDAEEQNARDVACILVPDGSTICEAARILFSSTPYSLHHLNNAFAVVKELRYVTESVVLHDPTAFISERMNELQRNVHLTATDTVPTTPHLSSSTMFQGLTEDMKKHLQAIQSTTGVPDMVPEEVTGDEPAQPRAVQLLVAHPQLPGYFRSTVMLVVQNSPTNTAAIVLNKLLLSEQRFSMPLRSVIRLIHVHGIFAHHLKDHPLMLGGPILPSGMERALTLLHRVPNIRGALPVGGDGKPGSTSLWINGDLDQLKERVEANEASVNDFVVFCGFAGWGAKQLEGEIRAGTWIVAGTSTSDNQEAMGDYLFELAKSSSQVPASETPAAATSEEEEDRSECMTSAGTAAWASVIKALPEGLRELYKY